MMSWIVWIDTVLPGGRLLRAVRVISLRGKWRVNRAEQPKSTIVDNSSFRGPSPHGTALHEESCYHLRVRIVEDWADADSEQCLLEVLAHLTPGASPCMPAIGTCFRYRRYRGWYCHGMPRLLRETDGGGPIAPSQPDPAGRPHQYTLNPHCATR